MKNLKQFRFYTTNNKNSFYASTPIYYVNASPHIGHLYSSVIADAISRWQQLLQSGKNKILATGTDEHGSKIQQAASKENKKLPEYCRDISSKYRELSDKFGVGYTDFIRTSEDRHREAVQNFWSRIQKNGYIYPSKYSGWYCVSDENFLTEQEIKEITSPNGEKILVSVESGHPVQWTEEQNYVFRLSAFQQDLINWLERNENSVRPKTFRKIVLEAVSKENLPDISVSRPCSRVHWGISVPGDEAQTVYVWLDALVNYLTVAGYPEVENEKFGNAWPPDVQVIGKDILKFHAIYWPAFLLAANLDLPRTIFCHSHWTVDGEKMSKSKHNVICPMHTSETYTADGLRYFLLREGVAHNDGNYSEEKLRRILNSELADTLGNLLNRCSAQALNPSVIYPAVSKELFQNLCSQFDVTKKLEESLYSLSDICFGHYQNYNFYKVVDEVMANLRITNLFFETMKPWELKKDPQKQDQLHLTLHLAMESLRISAIILWPIIPNLSERILDKLNVKMSERFWTNTKHYSWNDADFRTRSLSGEKLVLFRRIIQEKKKVASEK